VVVTFLRMDEPPGESGARSAARRRGALRAQLLGGSGTACSMTRWGPNILWWLRRTMPDFQALAAMLARFRAFSVYMLTVNGAPGGFL